MRIVPYLFLLFFFSDCSDSGAGIPIDSRAIELKDSSLIDSNSTTVSTRFRVPDGYERIEQVSQQFGYYLRNLPLKAMSEKVKYYDGRTKDKPNVYISVIDLPIGKKDLHQCADAVMRLRAEFLWQQQRYNDIHFNYTNGFKAEYSRWMNGDRIIIDSSRSYYKRTASPSNTTADLWKYLEQVFTYCGTLSLSKELKPVTVANIEPGDVFIKGGSPGHAVIVLDVARNKETGKKIFLLGQSYMPAQEIQVLVNPMSPDLSPWYSEDLGEVLYTPEWTFYANELKRFE